jgi:hypothetical protein
MTALNQTTNAVPVFLVNGDPTSPTVGAPMSAMGNTADLSYEDQRVWDGFGYTVSTAVVAVNAGNYLMAELANPASSGVNLIMTSRVMSSNIVGGQAPLEYARYASTAVYPASPSPTAVTVGNRIAGGTASPATFRFSMGTTLPSGTISSSGFVPTGGQEKRIKDIVIIPPGGKLIYAVGGAGGGLVASARIAMTFLFFTRPV